MVYFVCCYSNQHDPMEYTHVRGVLVAVLMAVFCYWLETCTNIPQALFPPYPLRRDSNEVFWEADRKAQLTDPLNQVHSEVQPPTATGTVLPVPLDSPDYWLPYRSELLDAANAIQEVDDVIPGMQTIPGKVFSEIAAFQLPVTYDETRKQLALKSLDVIHRFAIRVRALGMPAQRLALAAVAFRLKLSETDLTGVVASDWFG